MNLKTPPTKTNNSLPILVIVIASFIQAYLYSILV